MTWAAVSGALQVQVAILARSSRDMGRHAFTRYVQNSGSQAWLLAGITWELQKCQAPIPRERFQLRCRGWGIDTSSSCPGDSRVQPGLTAAGGRRHSFTAFLLHPALSYVRLGLAFSLSAKCLPNSFVGGLIPFFDQIVLLQEFFVCSDLQGNCWLHLGHLNPCPSFDCCLHFNCIPHCT